MVINLGFRFQIRLKPLKWQQRNHKGFETILGDQYQERHLISFKQQSEYFQRKASDISSPHMFLKWQTEGLTFFSWLQTWFNHYMTTKPNNLLGTGKRSDMEVLCSVRHLTTSERKRKDENKTSWKKWRSLKVWLLLLSEQQGPPFQQWSLYPPAWRRKPYPRPLTGHTLDQFTALAAALVSSKYKVFSDSTSKDIYERSFSAFFPHCWNWKNVLCVPYPVLEGTFHTKLIKRQIALKKDDSKSDSTRLWKRWANSCISAYSLRYQVSLHNQVI